MRSTAILLAVFGVAALLPATASADGQCEFDIDSDDTMQFDTNEMTIAADCDEVTVNLTHSGDLGVEQMGHNWVVVESDDLQAVDDAGNDAGLDHDYLPEDREGVIAATEMIGGGEETSVTFDADKLESGGDYTFFCSFPGHSGPMQGDVNVL